MNSQLVLNSSPSSLSDFFFFSLLPGGAGGEQTEAKVSKQEAKLLIKDFDPSKEYNFRITAINGGQESKALQAKHEGETPSSCRHNNGRITTAERGDITE